MPTLSRFALPLLLAATPLLAPAQAVPDGAGQLLSARAAAAEPGARVEVQVGQLDPRLRLAPCRKIEPQVPPGVPLAGRTRLMLACVEGDKKWRVSLPVTVKIWASAQTAATALPAGTVLQAHHLASAEVDLAEAPSPAVREAAPALGRTLARPLAAGATLRQIDLKARQWFASGDTVRLVAQGPGWRIAAEGQALSPGIEGSPARVRLDNGRVVQGQPVGPKELAL
ncbi:MAG: flagellar basal body P-ring formation chaperone FlgA [Proteobacteria bacterium]|nr:flagellar basal body P-ring formation chaperone FlgA [Pseudomonadota bacterium]